jgi:hypothetical protein
LTAQDVRRKGRGKEVIEFLINLTDGFFSFSLKKKLVKRLEDTPSLKSWDVRGGMEQS